MTMRLLFLRFSKVRELTLIAVYLLNFQSKLHKHLLQFFVYVVNDELFKAIFLLN